MVKIVRIRFVAGRKRATLTSAKDLCMYDFGKMVHTLFCIYLWAQCLVRVHDLIFYCI